MRRSVPVLFLVLTLTAPGVVRAGSGPLSAALGWVLAHVVQPGGWQGRALSADHLRLSRKGGDPFHDRLTRADLRVTASGDAPIAVEEIGFHSHPVEKVIDPWPPKITLRHDLLIRLSRPLADGESVTVSVRRSGLSGSVRAQFDANAVSPFLKINQVGYLPGDEHKTAYLAGFLGSLGRLPIEAPHPFEIVSAEDGAVRWRGTSLTRSRLALEYGEEVLMLPFDTFTEPGRYRVRVAGVGVSPAFRIAEDVYEQAYRTQLRAFYHHRCGLALRKPYTDYVRPACHPASREGCIHERFRETALRAGEKAGTCLGATGGWHDASDYGKYIPTAAPAVFDLLRLVELTPDLAALDDLGVPESGNGVPDLLDEVAWELDWMRKMQRRDGGVYHKLNGRRWADGDLPHEDTQRRWLADVTTHDTARFAAIMALGARHLAPYDAQRAKRYEAAARKAWRFLAKHPKESPKGGFKKREWLGGGDYGDRFGDDDERAWAAVELYALTGEAAFHKAFLKRVPSSLNPRTPPLLVRDWPPPFEDTWRFAFWSYVRLPAERSAEDRVQRGIRDAWEARASDLHRDSGREVYGLGFTPRPGNDFGYGATNGARYARDLLLACAVANPRPHWVRAALDNLAVLFGTNGRGLSYVTGIGERPVKDIAFRIDRLDDIAAPVPGHPVDGPSSFVHWSDRGFEESLFPARADYPPLQRYFDFPDVVMNEPTIDEMAAAILPVALLASRDFRVAIGLVEKSSR